MSGGAEIAAVLDRAADLIEPEGAWTQGATYRDDHGHSPQEHVHVAKLREAAAKARGVS